MFGEDGEEDTDEPQSPLNNEYITADSPHAMLELSFKLGMMGLDELLMDLDREHEPVRRYASLISFYTV